MGYKIREIVPVSIILLICLVFTLTVSGFASSGAAASDPEETEAAEVVEEEIIAPSPEAMEETETSEEPEYIYTDGSGYVLTDEERTAVECAVMMEAGGEGRRGQMMVAQSILDGAQRNDFSVIDMISLYSVCSTYHANVTEEVKESVSLVFDDGVRVTEQRTDLWYNPSVVKSLWHEEQQYVITVGSHRFFWMNSDPVQ